MTHRQIAILIVATAGFAAGCGSSDSGDTGELTQRQRDSAIGASGLPGAYGIQRAITASDSIARRSQRLDSLAGKP